MIGEGLCRERAARRAPRRSRGWAAGGRPAQREALWPCGRFFPRHRLDEGQRGRKRAGCKKAGSAAVQGTGRSRLLYRDEEE